MATEEDSGPSTDPAPVSTTSPSASPSIPGREEGEEGGQTGAETGHEEETIAPTTEPGPSPTRDTVTDRERPVLRYATWILHMVAAAEELLLSKHNYGKAIDAYVASFHSGKYGHPGPLMTRGAADFVYGQVLEDWLERPGIIARYDQSSSSASSATSSSASANPLTPFGYLCSRGASVLSWCSVILGAAYMASPDRQFLLWSLGMQPRHGGLGRDNDDVVEEGDEEEDEEEKEEEREEGDGEEETKVGSPATSVPFACLYLPDDLTFVRRAEVVVAAWVCTISILARMGCEYIPLSAFTQVWNQLKDAIVGDSRLPGLHMTQVGIPLPLPGIPSGVSDSKYGRVWTGVQGDLLDRIVALSAAWHMSVSAPEARLDLLRRMKGADHTQSVFLFDVSPARSPYGRSARLDSIIIPLTSQSLADLYMVMDALDRGATKTTGNVKRYATSSAGRRARGSSGGGGGRGNIATSE